MDPKQLVSLACGMALCACTAGEAEVAPPRFGFYYPTGLAITKDAEAADPGLEALPTPERFLFVASANADLRFAAGTIQTIDLAAVDAVVAPWLAPGADRGACTPSSSSPRTLLCPMEDGDTPASFVVPAASAQIGNFAVDVGIQPLADGKQRIFTTVRGDPSITWMDFDPTARAMDCGDTSSFQRCAEQNRLDVIRKDESLGTLVSEPFYLFVDNLGEHVFVSHLTSGAVTLVVAPKSGDDPYISDLQGNFFAPTNQGLLGATGIAGNDDGLIYVASPREARIARVRAVRGELDERGLENDLLVRVPDFVLVDNLSPGDRNDARALAFSADGGQLYVINRSTPQLLVYDVTASPTGAPLHRLVRRVEICGQAASLAVVERPRLDAGGAPLRLPSGKLEREQPLVYVPCFSNGQVWVIDPTRGTLDAIIESGRGPNAVVAAPMRRRVYVTNYAEDTVSVIDITPGAATENFVVMKLGVPRNTTLAVGSVSVRSLP